MAPSFASEFRTFLKSEENQTLLRNAITGPLMDTVNRLERALDKMKEVIKERDDSISQMSAQLKLKDATIGELKNELVDVQTKCDDLEQYSRRNSVRVQGIPEQSGEDPIEKTLEFANRTLQLNPPLLPSDVDRAHRVGRTPTHGRPRPLLIKFATYQQRFRVMKGRTLLKGTSMYVNEDLTRARTKLMFEARAAKREGKVQEYWSSDGRIYVKVKDEKHHITTYNDLCSIL